MAVLVYSRNDTDLIWSQQGVWGTAVAAAAAMSVFDGEAAVIDPNAQERRPNRSNSGARTLQDANLQYDIKGSSPTVSLNGDAKLLDLGDWLYAVFQKVVEGAITPFSKAFTFPATQPDFTAIATVSSPGWIGTLVEKHPIASAHRMMKDAILTDLTLSCSPDAGHGRLQITATVQGRGALTSNSNYTGTHTRTAQTFFNFHDLNLFQGFGQSLVPLGFEIKFSKPRTKGVGVSLTNAGDFLTFAEPAYDVTAKIKILWDANARSLQALIGSTISHAWSFGWGIINTTGYLNFALQAQPSAAPNVIEDVNAIEVSLTGVRTAAGVGPVTVTLCDAQDKTWPAA